MRSYLDEENTSRALARPSSTLGPAGAAGEDTTECQPGLL